MTNQNIWGICGLVIVGLILFAVVFGLTVLTGFHAHEHCIKQVGMAFRTYASDNNGTLPYDTNGFGNALLLLVKGGYLGDTNGQYSIGPVTGPGDNGSLFRQALKTGAPIPERQCSRIYIQGLSATNNPEIAILWDKKSSPGGDHFHRRWGPLLREVCLLDGSMQVVAEKSWAGFVSNQVELLVHDGIPKTRARRYYEIH
jgi:hypothetical protein